MNKFIFYQKGNILGKTSNKKSRSVKNEKPQPTQPLPEPVPIQSNNPIDTNPSIDLNKVVSDSQAALSTEKPKRHRRTKAEIEATRGVNPITQTALNTPTIDRTATLKPAFLLYSSMIADNLLGVPETKLSDIEAEAFASVTSNLMNAFPQYFNNTADPRIAALLGFAGVVPPVIFMKYRIYKSEKANKRPTPPAPNVPPPETKPQKSSDPINLSASNPFGVS